MDVDYSNIIIKCLGKALKTSIKYVSTGIIKFFDSSNKDITSIVRKERANDISKPCQVFICLGKEEIFILRSDMRQIFEKLSYDNLLPLELDKKNADLIHIPIKSTSNLKNSSLAKMSVIIKNRQLLLNNLRCYYTIYYEYKKQMIKTLDFVDAADKKEKGEGKKPVKFHEQVVKNYSFYLKGIVKKNQSIAGYHINYLVEKKKSEKNEKEDKEQKYLSEECDLVVDISDQSPLCKFDSNKNYRDLSYQAYSQVLSYLKNTLKSSAFWILKNELYTKKMNLNEDMSLWEGWRIEVRVCEPEYKNLLFIFLRRKYIPPYFDTYQDFIFILSEKCSAELYQINPEAYKILTLAANSTSTPMTSTVQENHLFLQAKVDSLLVDEETLYFYQNVYGVIGEDMYTFGYELLSALIFYFDKTNVKELVEPLKPIVESKKKKLGLSCTKWDFPSRNFEFMKKVKEYIAKMITASDNSKKEDLIDDDEGNILQTTTSITPTANGENGKKKNKPAERLIRIFTKKLMRFIGYILNGGLTDFKINYDKFLKDILDACQNTNNDIAELCYYTINLRDLQSPAKDSIFQTKSIIPSLNGDSFINFNTDPMNYCISSNFLPKYLEGSGAKFIGILLVKNCSNKLLKAIYDNLKYGNNPNVASEKRNMILLISPLRMIFENNRQNPLTLLLAGKSLCLLVRNETEKLYRIKLSDEGNVLETINDYLEEYNFDQQLVLCCLDLFSYIINEVRDRLKVVLYSSRGTGLMDKFLSFLEKPKVPGVYYPQRVMIKVLTILLTLTKSIEADVFEMFSTNQYRYVYRLFCNLLNDKEREQITDPTEEESSVLDFKIYYLMIILTSKNKMVQADLFLNLGLQSIIESNSIKYLGQMKALVSLNEKASDTEIKYIAKKVYKFFEMVYYLLINNDDRIREFMTTCPHFNTLKSYCDDKIYNLLNENDIKSDVLNMLSKIYTRAKEEYS